MAATPVLTTQKIIESLGGARVLKDVKTLEDLRVTLRRGLPLRALEALSETYGIAVKEMTNVIDVSTRTLARRKQTRRLRPDESDRLVRVARIAAMAADLIGSSEKAGRWLRKANRALRGAVPFELLDTELGARQVEVVLGRLAHGIPL